MTSVPERHMIRLDRKPQLFSMRVAALIFQNGHVLVQRGTKDTDDFAAHELGFYYLVSLRQPLPFHESDIVHRVLDGVEVEFRWLPAQPSALLKSDLRPRFIAERIEALPQRHEHLIVREGRRDAVEIPKEII